MVRKHEVERKFFHARPSMSSSLDGLQYAAQIKRLPARVRELLLPRSTDVGKRPPNFGDRGIRYRILCGGAPARLEVVFFILFIARVI